MATPRPARRALAVGFALVLVLAGCGDDGDGGDEVGSDRSSGTPTAETASTEVDATTSTTEAPRALTDEQLRGVLLQPEDVPHHLVVEDKEPPPGWQTTDPPSCGEQLSGEGPGEVRATAMFVDPEGFLAYESIADHTPGGREDLDAMRAAVAGPCSEDFRYLTTEAIDTSQRMTLLSDLDIGDEAFAARFDIDYTLEGYPAQAWAYMIYFRRGDVTIQVQAITGAVPSVDVVGPEITLEEVERVARRIDDRLVAL